MDLQTLVLYTENRIITILLLFYDDKNFHNADHLRKKSKTITTGVTILIAVFTKMVFSEQVPFLLHENGKIFDFLISEVYKILWGDN